MSSSPSRARERFHGRRAVPTTRERHRGRRGRASRVLPVVRGQLLPDLPGPIRVAHRRQRLRDVRLHPRALPSLRGAADPLDAVEQRAGVDDAARLGQARGDVGERRAPPPAFDAAPRARPPRRVAPPRRGRRRRSAVRGPCPSGPHGSLTRTGTPSRTPPSRAVPRAPGLAPRPESSRRGAADAAERQGSSIRGRRGAEGDRASRTPSRVAVGRGGSVLSRSGRALTGDEKGGGDPRSPSRRHSLPTRTSAGRRMGTPPRRSVRDRKDRSSARCCRRHRS